MGLHRPRLAERDHPDVDISLREMRYRLSSLIDPASHPPAPLPGEFDSTSQYRLTAPANGAGCDSRVQSAWVAQTHLAKRDDRNVDISLREIRYRLSSLIDPASHPPASLPGEFDSTSQYQLPAPANGAGGDSRVQSAWVAQTSSRGARRLHCSSRMAAVSPLRAPHHTLRSISQTARSRRGTSRNESCGKLRASAPPVRFDRQPRRPTGDSGSRLRRSWPMP